MGKKKGIVKKPIKRSVKKPMKRSSPSMKQDRSYLWNIFGQKAATKLINWEENLIIENESSTSGNGHPTKSEHHPIFRQKLTFGQRFADRIAEFGGSWAFITLFLIFLVVWMVVNGWLIRQDPFDPYPFILLNLTLSCLAAIQAPVILMTANRQTERDRLDAKYDHAVNRKAEREIQVVRKDLQSLRRMVRTILMEQNEQSKSDRAAAKYDHSVNRKAEKEIQELHHDILRIKS